MFTRAAVNGLLIRTVIVGGALVCAVPQAHANPRALPFTYTTDTLAPGQVELEQYADLTPLYGHDANTGARTAYLASELLTELEIGLAERLELGLYFTYAPQSAAGLVDTAVMPEGNGIKQRLRYTFADPGAWPIDVGVYGEVTENEREIELEGKILLQRRFDRLRIDANLWAEYEFYFTRQRDIVLHPTLGATYEVTPRFHVGVDSWLSGEYPRNPAPAVRTFGLGPQAYAGPAVLYMFDKIWWCVGVYARVTDTSHVIEPGEVYGPIWIRSMIGFNI